MALSLSLSFSIYRREIPTPTQNIQPPGLRTIRRLGNAVQRRDEVHGAELWLPPAGQNMEVAMFITVVRFGTDIIITKML